MRGFGIGVAFLLFSVFGNAQTPTTGDCLGAIPVCSDQYYESDITSGAGNYIELNASNHGCLLSNENQSRWYTFTAQTTGYFTFTIITTKDYDWALYDLTSNTCEDIINGTISNIRCSYSSVSHNTGLNLTALDSSEGSAGDGYCRYVEAFAGQTFVLLVDKYSNDSVDYTLDFNLGGGSVSVFDNVSPVLSGLSAPSCGDTSVAITFSEQVQCATLDVSNFRLHGPDGYLTITSVFSAACNAGVDLETDFTIGFQPPVTATGTYYVVVDTMNIQLLDGCGNKAAVDSMSFNITAVSAIITVNAIDTCERGTGELTVLPAGGSGSYTYSWSTTPMSNDQTISVLSGGDYTVTVSDGACICTQTVTLDQTQIPDLQILPASAEVCLGNNATLEASGADQYLWAPSASLSAGTGSSVIASPASTTTYTCVSESAEGCTATANVVVTVYNPPTVSINVNDTSICPGTVLSLTASGAITYTWAPATYLSATDAATVSASPDGSITYSATGTDVNGCEATDTVSLSIHTSNITINPQNPSVCKNDSVNIKLTGGVSYQWQPAAGLSTTVGSTVMASPASSATYSITYIDTYGCDYDSSVTVSVFSLPTISVSPQASDLCLNDTLLLHAAGANTYIWAPSLGLNTSTGSDVLAFPTSSVSYTVTGTDINNCSASNVATISILPLPNVSVQPQDTSFCPGQSVVLNAGGAISYSWSPFATLSASTGQSVTSTPQHTTPYTVTGTDNNGCRNTASAHVVVYPNPSIMLPAFPSICPGGSVTLTVSGGIAYTWAPPLGLSASVGSSVVASPVTTTTYSLTTLDVNGCTYDTTMVVQVNTNLVITPLVSNPGFCPGSGIPLNVSGAESYEWSPGTFLSATTGSSVVATPPSTVTISVHGYDSFGCEGDTTIAVIEYPVPTVICMPTDTTICADAEIVLSASGALSYEWSPGTVLSATTGNSVLMSTSSAVTITVVGTNAEGCTGQDESTIQLHPIALITTNFTDSSVCENAVITITAGGAQSYFWTPANYLSASTGSSVIAYATQTESYTITGTTPSGCVGTAVVNLQVFPNPTTISPNNPVLCFGDTAILEAQGATNYSWSPSIGLSGTSGPLVSTFPSSTIIYTVRGTDTHGCTNDTYVMVTVNPNPDISLSHGNLMEICPGIADTLIISGGTSYLWSSTSGITTISTDSFIVCPTLSTSYTITATNNENCQSVDSLNVSVFSITPFTISPAIAEVCPDSLLQVSLQGVQSFSMDPLTGISNLTSTSFTANPSSTITYEITGVDANGCISTQQYPINLYSVQSPTVLSSRSLAFCFGETPGAWLYTGISFATYDWSTGEATDSVWVTDEDSYSVLVTDANGCGSASDTVELINIPAFTPILLSDGGTEFCAGDTVYLYVDSVFHAYHWSSGSLTPSIRVTEDGIYSVTVTDFFGCDGISDSLTIESIAFPDAFFTWYDTLLTVNFQNLSENSTTWLWDFGDGQTDAGFNVIHIFADSGSYNVCLTAINSCGQETVCNDLILHSTSGIIENQASSDIRISQNGEEIRVQFSEAKNRTISLYHTSGKLIFRENNMQESLKFSTHNYSESFYFLIIIEGSQISHFPLFIKK
ncbi:MAG: PKD domain-containing protein [Bacteroidetes bacterium]|nr:PKD domain-containing protein [Bacteroidota bacterium]